MSAATPHLDPQRLAACGDELPEAWAAHLAQCPACRRLWEGGAAGVELEPPETVPAGLHAKVMARFDAEQTARARRRYWLVGLAWAVVLVAGAGALAGGWSRGALWLATAATRLAEAATAARVLAGVLGHFPGVGGAAAALVALLALSSSFGLWLGLRPQAAMAALPAMGPPR